MQGQIMLLEDASAILVIHFVYRSPPGVVRSRGIRLGPPRTDTWKVACSPCLVELSSGPGRPFVWHRTDDVRAVTCPLCQQTDVYISARQCLDEIMALRRASV